MTNHSYFNLSGDLKESILGHELTLNKEFYSKEREDQIFLSLDEVTKEFDFRNDEDMIYMLLWMEEMYPRMNIELDIPEMFPLKRDKKLGKFMREWKVIREKRDDIIFDILMYHLSFLS